MCFFVLHLFIYGIVLLAFCAWYLTPTPPQSSSELPDDGNSLLDLIFKYNNNFTQVNQAILNSSSAAKDQARLLL